MKVRLILLFGCLLYSFSFFGQESVKKSGAKVLTTPRQTQGATFGEKVQQGRAAVRESDILQQSEIKINDGMPNRISMNVTVASSNKRSINDGKKGILNIIRIEMNSEGCQLIFPDNVFHVNTADKLITPHPVQGSARVNAGLHQAGGAIASGAQLLGGALPGGSIISAAVSSVGTLSGGAGGGAASASYAATGRQSAEQELVCPIADSDIDATLDLPDGDYLLSFVLVEKATSGLKDTLKTQVKIYFSKAGNVLKTKHDTAKNSINNVR